MKSFYIVTISFIFFLNIVGVAFSQDVTLSWDPSPSSGVAGYKVYYKQGDMNYPFDGTGADQGPSPVDVGDVLSTTLTNLADDETFFFTVTAYIDASQESSFSNIVSNGWIPALLLPADGATDEPVPVTFQWETAPADYDVTYTLFYGTNEDEVTHARVAIPVSVPPNHQSMPPAALLFIAIGLLALTIIRLKQKNGYRPQLVVLTTAFFLAGILTACSGGGGSGSGDSSGDHSVTTPETTVFSVNKGSSDYHQAYDLEGSTTYYWKVVATDTQDPNLTYESEVVHFTTEAF